MNSCQISEVDEQHYDIDMYDNENANSASWVLQFHKYSQKVAWYPIR